MAHPVLACDLHKLREGERDVCERFQSREMKVTNCCSSEHFFAHLEHVKAMRLDNNHESCDCRDIGIFIGIFTYQVDFPSGKVFATDDLRGYGFEVVSTFRPHIPMHHGYHWTASVVKWKIYVSGVLTSPPPGAKMVL